MQLATEQGKMSNLLLSHTRFLHLAPAGMCAAVYAARNGADVTIIEKNTRLGKKLSVTGNGRCNLTNLDMRPEYYNKAAEGRMKTWLSLYGPEETIRFFKSIGVIVKSEDGYIYPRNIFGGNDSYIRKIEDSLHVEIIDRNGELRIIGEKEGANKASSIIRELVQLSRRGSHIEEQSVDYAISLKEDAAKNKDVTQNDNVLVDIDRDIICHTVSGKPIKPKTLGQKKYIDAIRNKMIVFGLLRPVNIHM